MAERIPQSTTPRILLKAFLSTDHITEATGKTIAVTISKNGAAFGNPSAGATNATEIANGWYYVDLSATDTATLGPLIVRGTATGVDNSEIAKRVVNANNGGLAALPDTAVTTNASLLTSGTGTAQVSVASGAVILTSAERNSVADALLDRAAGVETGITPRQGWRLMLAAMAGKASGLATSTAVYRDTNDTKNRITATVDSSGNRTAVTLDAS